MFLQPHTDTVAMSMIPSTCTRSSPPLVCSSSSPASKSFYSNKNAVSGTGTFSPFLNKHKPLQPMLRHLEKILNDVPKTIKKNTAKLLDAFVDSAFEFVDQPLLPSQANFAPVEEAKEAISLVEIQGNVPEDFPEGVYVRNGPNPLFGGFKTAVSILGKSSHTWIEGEGMLHALHFIKDTKDSGKWTLKYINKYLRPETFKHEIDRAKPAFLPAAEGDPLAVLSAHLLNLFRFGMVDKHLSNTNVFEHSGRYFATAENHAPQEFDLSTLETHGTWDVDGKWNRPFTSHPKKVPATGELVVFGISAVRPYYELGVISADGREMIHSVDIQLNRCTLCHDIGITERYNVILDLPLTIDVNRLMNGGSLIRYEEESHARIGVMPRYGDADSLKWFEVEPCTAFHLINCFEDGDEVVVMACRARGSMIPGPEFGSDKFDWFSRGFKQISSADTSGSDSQEGAFFARVYEWRLNIQSGEVKGRYLTGTELSMDFPIINDRFNGEQNKYGYTQVVDTEASSTSGMAKYGGIAKLHFEKIKSKRLHLVDAETGEFIKVECHKFPEDTYCTGVSFVRKFGGVEEDDGWLIAFTHNERTNLSQVLIVDAKKVSSEPIAKITLPTRVPYGFHGAFLLATDSLTSSK